jgi:hypothetical protein
MPGMKMQLKTSSPLLITTFVTICLRGMSPSENRAPWPLIVAQNTSHVPIAATRLWPKAQGYRGVIKQLRSCRRCGSKSNRVRTSPLLGKAVMAHFQ